MIASALKMLRDEASLSQPALAAKIAVGTDPISVSRWERGVAMPHPDTRKRLAEISLEYGRKDLADAFADPAGNWRAALANNRMLDELLVLLEIAAINLHILQTEPDYGEYEIENEALWGIARMIQGRLLERHGKGQEILLINDAQRDWWFTLLEEMGAVRPGKRFAQRIEKKKTR